MEESGSEGLDELIESEVKKGKNGWFDGVDCVCIVCDTAGILRIMVKPNSISKKSLIITGSTRARQP